jgi:hypothetical protein
MKANHTKTEWKVSDQGANGTFISSGIGSESGAVAKVFSPNSIIKTDEEAKANALLIAAAPKGLQVAINMYVKILMTPSESWRIRNQEAYIELREFIADATGYSPQHVQEFYEQVMYDVKCHGTTIENAIKNQEKIFLI